MRKWGVFLAGLTLVTVPLVANPGVPPAPAVAQEAELAPGVFGAKNVILFVGDGMSLSTVTAARIREGQLAGGPGEGNLLSFEKFPTVGLSRIYSVNAQVPDSAASMTAMMTGVKTDNGLINVDRGGVRRDCATVAGNELTSWLMRAENLGLATGVVSTARLTHATPAATYAVSVERNFEDDADLPAGCNRPDIARQLIEFPYGDGLEVALGGGRANFTPTSVADPEYPRLAGLRTDGRNLTSEWAARPGAGYVWNRVGFDGVDPATTTHLLGLFERSHMRFEADRAGDVAGEPSLTEMTELAIEMLSRDTDGFALVVEAARVDHAHHDTNAYRALADTIELSNAVARAVAMVDVEETLIVVTADHGHSLTISGDPSRGNDILGLADRTLGSDGLPYTTLGYATGPEQHRLFDGTRVDLSAVDTTAKGFVQPALVPSPYSFHSGEDMPIYSIGPRDHKLGRSVGQGKIGRVLWTALRLFHVG